MGTATVFRETLISFPCLLRRFILHSSGQTHGNNGDSYRFSRMRMVIMGTATVFRETLISFPCLLRRFILHSSGQTQKRQRKSAPDFVRSAYIKKPGSFGIRRTRQRPFTETCLEKCLAAERQSRANPFESLWLLIRTIHV